MYSFYLFLKKKDGSLEQYLYKPHNFIYIFFLCYHFNFLLRYFYLYKHHFPFISVQSIFIKSYFNLHIFLINFFQLVVKFSDDGFKKEKINIQFLEVGGGE